MTHAPRLAALLMGLTLGIGSALADPPHRQAPGHGDRYWQRDDHRHGPRAVLRPPPPVVVWRHAPYRVDRGPWVRPIVQAPVYARPRHGHVLHERPSWATAVLIGGLTYLVAEGIYYRERQDRRWEVVSPPVGLPAAPPEAPGKLFIYPRHGQAPSQQRDDEYECHRWAGSQTGVDPSRAATGAWPPIDVRERADYDRAFGGCMDARGYTVR